MSTNDIIIGKVSKGSFKFPIEFQMFGNLQLIPNATFDTGCSHSLISAKSLNIGGFSIEELKVSALYDKNVNLSIGKSVESKDIDTTSLHSIVHEINKYKKALRNSDICQERAKQILKQHITNEAELNILESKNVRYEYQALGYKIDGVEIGDFNVKVSFNLANVNLIGMHIIKELYTKLFSYDNQIYLLAKKNCPNADMELNEARYKMEKFLKKCDFF